MSHISTKTVSVLLIDEQKMLIAEIPDVPKPLLINSAGLHRGYGIQVANCSAPLF
jgi:hypothetical protein